MENWTNWTTYKELALRRNREDRKDDVPLSTYGQSAFYVMIAFNLHLALVLQPYLRHFDWPNDSLNPKLKLNTLHGRLGIIIAYMYIQIYHVGRWRSDIT